MVDTAEERALDIYRVPARRLGVALLEVRRQRGLTRRQVEQAVGGRPSVIRLRAIERGRRRITAEELDSLARVYGVELSSLMPSRRPFTVDLQRGVLFFNGEEHPLDDDLSPSSVLAQYLGLVRSARDAANTAAITLRSTDLRVLGTAFGTSRAALRSQLADVMGTPEDLEPAEESAEPGPLVIQEIERPMSQDLAIPSPERTREVMVYGEGPRPLDAELVTELEGIYDELSIRSSQWLPRSKRRSAERRMELVAKESALLDELGFESWSAMVIGIALGEATLPHEQIAIPYDHVEAYLGTNSEQPSIAAVDPLALKTMDVIVRRAEPIAPAAVRAAPVPSPSVSTSGSTSWQEFANHRVTHTEAPASGSPELEQRSGDDWATAPFEDDDLSRFDSLPSFVEFGKRLDEGFVEDSDLGNGTFPGR